jgi:hypothetical protein
MFQIFFSFFFWLSVLPAFLFHISCCVAFVVTLLLDNKVLFVEMFMHPCSSVLFGVNGTRHAFLANVMLRRFSLILVFYEGDAEVALPVSGVSVCCLPCRVCEVCC